MQLINEKIFYSYKKSHIKNSLKLYFFNVFLMVILMKLEKISKMNKSET